MSEYDSINPLMMRSMKDYVEKRERPGHFLTAVICNNLTDAIGRADSDSLENLRPIVLWFFNKAPATCWGSKEKMDDWLSGKSEGVLEE